ncbi:DNA cytosine methyltransferase [Actinocorallia aurantiaca]|uniref:DNA cytosine methyltransferase n=1 Tax=Actinocorallia aurantiaca TaxID=46204 RepID=UPI0031D0B3FE
MSAPTTRRRMSSALTFVDLFCGAGGSSLGLTSAGLELKLAANHWERAIATHAANFPHAEHLCEDINAYDMRDLPPARVLWASPICQESSPAGGRRKKRGSLRPGQLALMDDGEREEYLASLNKGWERTRATAYDVLRAVEIWAYDAVLIENVVEFATDWPLFWWWIEGMNRIGYSHRIVCVNSAHIGGADNPHAPQWRDRLYIVFLRADAPMPDLEPRPPAHCFTCGQDVAARQTWKRHTPGGKLGIGKYRDQYTYTCPNTSVRHESFVVEPYVLPAAAVIDWTDLGQRIGERARPLAAQTMRRIRAGLAMVQDRPVVVQVNHAGHDGRTYPAAGNALAARTVRGGDGFVSPPLLVPAGGTWNTTARPAAHPLATVTAGGNHHFLVTPDQRPEEVDRHALVIPYRAGNLPTTTASPLHTVATRDSMSLVRPEVAVEDCRFRMLKAREHLRAQRFPDTYTVTGNQAEQTMQAGNAVSANVARWLGSKLLEVL